MQHPSRSRYNITSHTRTLTRATTSVSAKFWRGKFWHALSAGAGYRPIIRTLAAPRIFTTLTDELKRPYGNRDGRDGRGRQGQWHAPRAMENHPWPVHDYFGEDERLTSVSIHVVVDGFKDDMKVLTT